MNDELKTLRTEVERLQKQNAAMREALYAARQVIDTYEPAPMANVEARWKIENALATDAASTLLTRAQVQPLIKALIDVLAHESKDETGDYCTWIGEGTFNKCNAALALARTLGFHS